uniref:Uncharacterized protein n=1 Tax=Mustela putorius furo TaxID=9669 RepID=M3XQ85_MUSPF
PRPLSHRGSTALQSELVKLHDLNSEHSGSSPGRTTLGSWRSEVTEGRSSERAPPRTTDQGSRDRQEGPAMAGFRSCCSTTFHS